MTLLSEVAYNNAIQLLLQASTEKGFVASVHSIHNYKRIWTRDGVVVGMASLCSENNTLIQTFKQHLITIFNHQHASGFLPSNVDTTNKKVSYGGSVGRTDNGSWGIIGLCLYALHTRDFDFLKPYKPAIEKIFFVMDVWEFNGKHLIYMPQSGNWADEYFGHGYILSEQLLRIWALKLAAKIFNEKKWDEKANTIQAVVETNFWNNETNNPNLYFQTLQNRLHESPKNFWLMGFNPSGYYQQFDLLANALSLMLNIGTATQQTKLTVFIENYLTKNKQSILPCFFPAIKETDKEMQELKNLFAFEFRNHPGEFHNGGLWTVWNSFMVWGLANNNEKNIAPLLTQKIHDANELNNWDFNECIQHPSNKTIGVSKCSWSAAASIIAEKNIVLKKLQL